MVSDSECECLAKLVSELEVETIVPVSKGSLDVGVDVCVVPEEVVADSLSEEARVSEDGEELS